MFERYKIKKLLKPRKAFAEQTKTAFLAVFDVKHPAGAFGALGQSKRSFASAFAKTMVALGALLAIFASVSAYADTANVAADSPLYPLKRLGESVQLAVAPAPEKAELQATFAARRASEVAYLEARTPSSTRIAALSNDLSAALDNSLDDAQSAKLSDGQLTTFCDKVLIALEAGTHPVIVHRFAMQCGASVGASSSPQLYRVGGGFGIGPVSSTASSTASSTITIPFKRLLRGAIINNVVTSSSVNIFRLRKLRL